MTKSLTGFLSATFGGVATNPEFITTTRAALPPIQIQRWVRNGKHPNGMFQTLLNQHVNQAAMYRGKCVFVSPSSVTGTLHAAASQVRHRFAFHTGPYTRAMMAIMGVWPNAIDFNGNGNGYGQIDLTDSSGTVTAKFNAGGSHNTTRGGPSALDWSTVVFGSQIMTVNPDSDYTGAVSEGGWGTVAHCCLYELPSLSELSAGYLVENLGALSSIYSDYRTNAHTILRNLWRRGCSQLVNVVTDDDLATQGFNTNSAPYVDISNLLFSGQHTLDLTGMARRSQQTTGVPVVMKAYGMGTLTNAGSVALTDLSNNVIMEITPTAWQGGIAGWRSVSGTLPAGPGQYKFRIKDGSSFGFQLSAISVYAYTA